MIANDYIVLAMRMSLTDMDHILGNHHDDNNNNKEEEQSPVVCYSQIVYHEGPKMCLAIIGYCRKSIHDYIVKRKLHASVIKAV